MQNKNHKLLSTTVMQRALRLVHASLYACCVVRVGGRLGRLCGSERAGRGFAVLVLLVWAIIFALYALAETFYISRYVFLKFGGTRQSGGKVGLPGVDQWGRDTRSDVHFIVPGAAYADLDAAAQAQQRNVYAKVEERKHSLVGNVTSRYPGRVMVGVRDPNALRLNPALVETLARPVEAVVDGIALYRPPGVPALPHVQTHWRTYTPAELYERYDDLDFIYSFVNGTESNHYYRKTLRVRCGDGITAQEEKFFRAHTRSWASPALRNDAETTTTGAPLEALFSTDAVAMMERVERDCPYYHMMKNLKNGEFLERFSGAATAKSVDERDRETDELRHSIRSLEQHVQWHRGRVVIVSPGHHPTWVDGAKNFLAGVCGDAAVQALRTRGTHLRLTTVHQDAIMPYGMRFTANSHSIEQHMWRVLNTTSVHVYMNDDYFVNRDVAITDLFNEYGGTIVRTEASAIAQGRRGSESVSWADGVANTELFNIYHLEHQHEDHLPPSLTKHLSSVLRLGERTSGWHKLFAQVRDKAAQLTGVKAPSEAEEAVIEREVQDVLSFRELLLAANNSFYVEAALEPPATVGQLPNGQYTGVYKRYFATHAPFVYCTNMFRHLSVRFEYDFAPLQFQHRQRWATDLFVPFLYNAYIMARPWEASAQFLPYLLRVRHAAARAAAETKVDVSKLPSVTTAYYHERLYAAYQKHFAKYAENISIYLDNEDGCAPATLFRSPASDVTYMRALDDLELNRRVMDQVTRSTTLYFNINAGFSTAAAANQVRAFLRDKFPTATYLETPTEERKEPPVRDALAKLFNELMQLPVVGVVSYEEGACPLVRSLSLAFAGHHRGRVHVAVQRHGDGAADETLREARTRLSHRIVSAVPATSCTFGRQVNVGLPTPRESIADLAARVIGELNAGVELPSTCGGGGGGSGGLRVRGFVIDARTPHAPVQSDAALREALAMPGQTLALEDFRAVRVGPEERDVVLVLAREDAATKAVHWITGASENDLLLTYPLPTREYEDMTATVKWAQL